MAVEHAGHTQKTPKTRCNECKRKHEAEEQRVRQANLRMVVPITTQPSYTSDHHIATTETSPQEAMVTMFCPSRTSPKDIPFNKLWPPCADEHGFKKIQCEGCKATPRLGKRLRRVDEDNNSIQDWLRYNNGDTHSEQPQMLTVNTYNHQDITHTMTLATKLMVAMYCPSCTSLTTIGMNMFWQRENADCRFKQVKCDPCKFKPRLGKWLRRLHEAKNSIENLLQYNDVYTLPERPETLTMATYNHQDITDTPPRDQRRRPVVQAPPDNLESQPTSRKRTPSVAPSVSAGTKRPKKEKKK